MKNKIQTPMFEQLEERIFLDAALHGVDGVEKISASLTAGNTAYVQSVNPATNLETKVEINNIPSIYTNILTKGTLGINGVEYDAMRIRVHTDSYWIKTELFVWLGKGNMYNDWAGGNTEPNPAFFAVFPSLEWDTYARTPAGFPELATFDGSIVMNDTDFHATWYDTQIRGPGDFDISQITLSNGARGVIWGKNYDANTQSEGVPFFYPFYNYNKGPIGLYITAHPNGPYVINPGGSITLNGGGSYSDGGDIVSYDWDLNGDGKWDTSNGMQYSLSYSELLRMNIKPGNYTAILKIEDASGYYCPGGTDFKILPPATGDANRDGLVNDSDLSLVLSNWQYTGVNWTQGDFNLDGTVNDSDLSLLLSNWTGSQGSTATPEPASLGILGVGALGYFGLSYFRKRNRKNYI